MSVTKTKNGRFSVRVQYKNQRARGGTHDTEFAALKAEKSVLAQLKALESLSIDNCGPYEPKLEQTDTNLINKLVRAFRKRKAEKELAKL